MLATKERIIAQRSIATERAILSSLPVLYLPLWKRDSGGSNQFLSDDGAGHLCTVTGTLLTQQGRDFNGTSNVIDIPATVLVSAPAITVAVWLKDTDVASATMYVLDAWNGTFLLRIIGNVFDWRIAGGAGVVTGTTLLNDSKYHFGVFTHDGTTERMFVDTIEEGTPVSLTTALSNSVAWTLGSDRAKSTVWLKGTVGEVIIYHRALSISDIRQLYLATRWRYQ